MRKITGFVQLDNLCFDFVHCDNPLSDGRIKPAGLINNSKVLHWQALPRVLLRVLLHRLFH